MTSDAEVVTRPISATTTPIDWEWTQSVKHVPGEEARS